MDRIARLILLLLAVIQGLEAIDGRAGFCPQLNTIQSTRCDTTFSSLCFSDIHCAKTEKCCGYCCTKVDSPPIATTAATVSTITRGCPSVVFPLPEICRRVRLSFECGESKSCGTGLTCCRTASRCNTGQCLNLHNTQISRCPIRVSTLLPVSCNTATELKVTGCQADSSCSGGEICCPDECGIQTCQTPPTATPPPTGVCPSVISPLPEICRRVRLSFECGETKSCEPGLTCCRTASRCNTGQCLNLDNTQNPQCPITVASPLPSSCNSAVELKTTECQSNIDCSVGELCCPDQCGIQSCY